MVRQLQNFRIAFCVFAALASAGGCSDQRSSDQASAGKIEIALNVAGGGTLDNATYYIMAPNGVVSSGTVPVGNSAQVSVTVGPLPVASGYTLIVTGVASDGQTGCSGTTTFDITSGAQSTVVVGLQCSKTGAGQALVVGTVNVCPVIDGVNAAPSSAMVGATMALNVVAHDPDVQPSSLTYVWSATGGATLSGTTGASPVLTCTSAGPVTINVSASDGDAACTDHLSFNVTCTGAQ